MSSSFQGLCVKLMSDRLRYAHLEIQIRTSGRTPDQDLPVFDCKVKNYYEFSTSVGNFSPLKCSSSDRSSERNPARGRETERLFTTDSSVKAESSATRPLTG